MTNNDAGVTSSIEVITPNTAREWLALNVRNRTVNQGQVSRIAREIEAGRWILNGDPIRFGADGTLYDGQHRLYAVVSAGVAITSNVVRGLDVQARDMIDLGSRRRNARDIVEITDDVKISSAQVAWMSAAEHMLYRGSLSNVFSLSVSGLRDATQRHGTAADTLTHVMSLVSGGRRIAPAAVMGSLLIAWSTSRNLVERFAAVLKTGEANGTDDPAIALRNFLIAQFGRTYGAQGRDDISLRTFGALDAFAKGEAQRITHPNPMARRASIAAWSDAWGAKRAPVVASTIREDVAVTMAGYVSAVTKYLSDGSRRTVDQIANECDIPEAMVSAVMAMVPGASQAGAGVWTVR